MKRYAMPFILVVCFALSLTWVSADVLAQQRRPIDKRVPSSGSKTTTPTPSITVLQPDQKAEWCIGGQYAITWQSSLASSASLKIDLIDSMGGVFKQLAGNVPCNGTYSWTIVPAQFNFGQGFFRVRVSTPDGTTKGESPRFSIGKQLFLEAPKSQFTWRKGSSYDIKWFQGCAVSATQLKIELLNTSKQLVATIVNGVPIRASAQSYGNVFKWTVPPETPSGTYWIRITTADGQFTSESSFTIADPLVQGAISQGIKVVKPDGASEWCIGSTNAITWESGLPPGTNLKIDVLGSTRQPFQSVAGSIPNTGSYSWTISPSQYNFGLGFFHIKVSTQDGSSFAESDRFKIGRELFLDNPKSQYVWRKGSSYTIAWSQGCTTAVTQVKIELLDAGKQLVSTIAQSVPVRRPNYTGSSLSWAVPADLTPGTYWIRVTTADGQFTAESSFAVAEPAS
jgi:hypothetical protein